VPESNESRRSAPQGRGGGRNGSGGEDRRSGQRRGERHDDRGRRSEDRRGSGGGRRSGEGRRGRDGGDRVGGGGGRDAPRRDRGGDDAPKHKGPPKTVTTSGGNLPGWAAEEVQNVAQRGQGREAVEHLAAAVAAFVAGKYGKAERSAAAAKQLAPRSPTVREVLGLSAYRLGRWEEALRELRTYRRLTGATFNMPVEMDVLRAMERPEDVEKVWELLRRLGGSKATMDEGRVVFASFLLDRDEARRAWEVANPGRIGDEPRESELRVWYVAARAAARLGDRGTARRLYEAIQDSDPAFPGLDELDAAIGG